MIVYVAVVVVCCCCCWCRWCVECFYINPIKIYVCTQNMNGERKWGKKNTNTHANNGQHQTVQIARILCTIDGQRQFVWISMHFLFEHSLTRNFYFVWKLSIQHIKSNSSVRVFAVYMLQFRQIFDFDECLFMFLLLWLLMMRSVPFRSRVYVCLFFCLVSVWF